MKKVLPFILIIFILTGVGIAFYLNNKVVYNQDNTSGNTPGNLLNGGLFCEDGDKIYFSNQNDYGSLYVMDKDLSNIKKIYDDKSAYINAAGKYIYYTRQNNLKDGKTHVFVMDKTGVYRLNKDGRDITQLSKEITEIAGLSGNYVYYQFYADGGFKLNKVKIDKKEEALLSSDPVPPIAIKDNVLYYSGTERDHFIHAMDLSNGSDRTILEGNYGFCTVFDNYLYFLDLENNYALTRCGLDGSNPVTMVENRISTYNISLSGKYIYYQVDDGESNGLYRLNTESHETHLIQSGNFHSIHVSSDWVFFLEFGSNLCYVLSSGESSNVTAFQPPVESFR